MQVARRLGTSYLGPNMQIQELQAAEGLPQLHAVISTLQ